MKKYFLLMTVSSILLGTFTGVAAGSFTAKQITYIPSDNTWKVSNVSDAIDSIKFNKTRDNYSYDEKVIGTWVDGREIYQRSFNITTPSTTGNPIETNVDYYTDLDFIISYMLPNIDGGLGNSLLITNSYGYTGNMYLNGNKRIIFEANNASYLLGKSGVLTIQYVKTASANSN